MRRNYLIYLFFLSPLSKKDFRKIIRCIFFLEWEAILVLVLISYNEYEYSLEFIFKLKSVFLQNIEISAWGFSDMPSGSIFYFLGFMNFHWEFATANIYILKNISL